jgi:predicted DNA-binding transcriptional regulator YafY
MIEYISKGEIMRLKMIKKLVDAITLLSQPTGTTISALCERLDIDKRQAYRVIDEIQSEFKIMIEKDKALLGGEIRYYLDKEFTRRLSEIKVADLNLTLAEIISLYFIKGHARLYRGTDIETNIERAFSKLDVFVPEGLSEKLDNIKTLFMSADKLTKDYTGKEKTIEKLTDAVLQQRTCIVDYNSFSSGKVKTFNIDPLKLFDWNGGLYLWIRVSEYDDIRTLAVERINNISITRKEFSRPNNFNPDELMEDTFGIIYDDPVSVKIHFCAKQAPYIQERQWCKNQNIEILKDGSIILTMNTSGWYDIKKMILSFGPDAELLEPADKRQEIKEAIKQMAILYK